MRDCRSATDLDAAAVDKIPLETHAKDLSGLAIAALGAAQPEDARAAAQAATDLDPRYDGFARTIARARPGPAAALRLARRFIGVKAPANERAAPPKVPSGGPSAAAPPGNGAEEPR